MKNLYLYDVSALVYYGTEGAKYGCKNYLGLPIGGISALMWQLSLVLGQGHDVLLAMDSRSFRKDLFKGYKAGRIPNRSVGVQLDFLSDYLVKAGLPVCKYDGFEGDDIIAWACNEFYGKYGEIVIRANDMDLAHNVRNGIRLKPIDTNKVIITAQNFERCVDRHDIISFNTISAHKVFLGCTSDKIPAFKSTQKYRNKDLYNCFVKFLEKYNLTHVYAATTDKRVLAAFINESGLFDDDEKDDLFNRIELVYPADRPDGIVLHPGDLHSINLNEYCALLTMCNDYSSIECVGGKRVFLDDQFKNTIKSYKKLLNTGAYSVDKNLEVDPTYEVSSSMLFLKEF